MATGRLSDAVCVLVPGAGMLIALFLEKVSPYVGVRDTCLVLTGGRLVAGVWCE